MNKQMILYLHGFRSSPQSFKTRLLAERMTSLGKKNEYHCPQLPASPRAAIALASSITAGFPAERIALIGSSLGGFYATWMAEQLGCRAVLLNPAVSPARDLGQYVGLNTVYHSSEAFEFRADHIEELHELTVPHITKPERYFLLAATGDEVLDWREMVARYPGVRKHVIDGGDHGLSDFDRYADEVLKFCGIEPAK